MSHPSSTNASEPDAAHQRLRMAQGAETPASTGEPAVGDPPTLAAAFDELAEGLALLDGRGRVLRVNEALCRLLELAPEEVHLPCGPDTPVDCPERLCQLVWPGGSRGQVMGPYEIVVHRPSLGPAVLNVDVTLLQDGSGGQVRLVREARRRLGLFISQIAHELRRPLQHIMSFTSLLSEIEDLSEEEKKRFLCDIQDEASALARLFGDLVQLAHIDADRFSVRLEPVRIDELVANTVAKLRYRAQSRDLSLEFVGAPAPVWAITDPVRLEQVLANLLENCLKYVPARGSVSVRVEAKPEEVVVRVADSGPGMAPESLAHMFEQYYRGEQEMGNTPGMGLGLFTSQQIMHAMGGNILVESELGVGSTFSVSLPRLDQLD